LKSVSKEGAPPSLRNTIWVGYSKTLTLELKQSINLGTQTEDSLKSNPCIVAQHEDDAS